MHRSGKHCAILQNPQNPSVAKPTAQCSMHDKHTILTHRCLILTTSASHTLSQAASTVSRHSMHAAHVSQKHSRLSAIHVASCRHFRSDNLLQGGTTHRQACMFPIVPDCTRCIMLLHPVNAQSPCNAQNKTPAMQPIALKKLYNAQTSARSVKQSCRTPSNPSVVQPTAWCSMHGDDEMLIPDR